jgi:hypothetical protein
MPCKVERYNEDEGTADVVPLFMIVYADGWKEAYELVTNVPVVKRKWKDDQGTINVETPFYESGDIVLVVFAERALDNAMVSRSPVDPGSSRKHSIDDAIIVGLLR